MPKTSHSSKEEIERQKKNEKDYESLNDFLIQRALEELKQKTIDLYNIQLNVGKTYLWLSALILGAIFSALAGQDFQFQTMTISQSIGIPTLLASAFFALEVFVIGTKLLVGSDTPVPLPSYTQALFNAYNDGALDSSWDEKLDWLSYLDDAVEEVRQINNSKGRILRSLNPPLVTSTLLGVVGATILYIFS